MYLHYLDLLNYRNRTECHLQFVDGLNAFLGANGCGKTNLLDAIHTLCLTKGAAPLLESENVRHGEQFYLIKGGLGQSDQSREVKCAYQTPRKQFLYRDVPYQRVSEHIGKFPCVAVWPDDTELVKGSSELRRKFFDHTLSQIDREYLQSLMRYNQTLKQRNRLLKDAAERNRLDMALLQIYDGALIPLAQQIADRRRAAVRQMEPHFAQSYQHLSDQAEQTSLIYESEATLADFADQFKAALPKDRALQRTTKGIHKDDYAFMISDLPLKKFGSQGQQKTFVLALKLAQFKLIEAETGKRPLLLLDDIFDKLDDTRISKLLDLIHSGEFGQIFLTDARPERTKGFFSSSLAQVRFFDIDDLG